MSQRAEPRFPTHAIVEFRQDEGNAEGTTRNISKGGLCATVAAPLPLGAEMPISVTLLVNDQPATEPVVVRGRIVWCTAIEEQHQIGVSFVGVTPEQRRTLQAILELLEE